MARALVIVESPAKARTIGRLLGPDYQVEASIGHVRDLPRNASEIPTARKKEPWARLGVDIEGGFTPIYVVPAEKKPQVKKLKELLADAPALYLATDEDREGESISWHLLEVLKPRVPVHRLVFHEITAAAIHKALASPRAVDENLVRAQETRRVLDRLYGYEVSPLLWRKVGRGLSAGRVQSVAVRLVVDRERARLAFRTAEWWDVAGPFDSGKGSFDAEIVEWSGARIASGKDFDEHTGALKSGRKVKVLSEVDATKIASGLSGGDARVSSVEQRPYRDRPSPPFTTSTLQQEANRKLRWTARKTMRVAQQLYENGWITYMRTDSLTLSEEAVAAARRLIREQYGADYLPARPRIYKSQVKNAQEAHEAIRPAGSAFRTLEAANGELERDAARLYELIWKRTVACQMEEARGHNVSVLIAAGDGVFQARGKTIEFPGYRRAYVEGADNPEAELADQERILPPLVEGQRCGVGTLAARRHQTQPPARLTEATLVKELEARGIGRPSTYASIIDTILQRDYVFKKGNALVPTFTAFAVTQLLESNLGWLVDYDFTARMEEQLDEVALGKRDPTAYLQRFYLGDEGLRDQLKTAEKEIDPRAVCTIPVGTDEDGADIAVRVGKYGPFLAAGDIRADIPEGLPPDELTLDRARDLLRTSQEGPRGLGADPATGKPIFLMRGRFGPYVQLGEAEGDEKPPRASLLKGMVEDELDRGLAVALLGLPRELGVDPASGEKVYAASGRYGAYVKVGAKSRSLTDERKVLSIELAEALEVLAQAPTSRRRAPEPLRELGADPKTGRTVRLMEGRYGPYVTDGETNASLPKGTAVETFDLERAVELIRSREGIPKRPRRGGRKAASDTKKTTAKKPAAKKAPAKKAPAKAAADGAGAETAAKKPAAKKPAAKKPAAKKTSAKKTSAKKTSAPKAGSRAPDAAEGQA